MIAWVDAGAGAAGDMLLGALLDLGGDDAVALEGVVAAVEAVVPGQVGLAVESTRRCGLRATRALVAAPAQHRPRTWAEIRDLLTGADLPHPVRQTATAAFTRLAEAEGAVHGVPADDVHFHEVGALDAIADVVGVAAALAHLRSRGLDRVVVSRVAVGSGRTAAAHGSLPVPAPAVVALLRGVPSYAGPGAAESCTPTGAALLTTIADGWGPQPPMTVREVGVGAGGRDPDTHPNVLRVLLGEPADATQGAVVLEANVDDLDPRLWPPVLAALLAAGASDAWLTPILMKKGRPAHTLSALVSPDRLPALRREVFRQTSTIGLREIGYAKTALERTETTVEVDRRPVRVKVARLDGEVVNRQPEFEDVAAVAAATGRPVKDVLAEAAALARGSAP